MIKVTRLNNSELVVNTDMIEFIEAIPDTIISLSTGKKVMVKESIEEVVTRVQDYQRKIHHFEVRGEAR